MQKFSQIMMLPLEKSRNIYLKSFVQFLKGFVANLLLLFNILAKFQSCTSLYWFIIILLYIMTNINSGLTSSLTKWQRDSPMELEVTISRKSMVGFEGLWAHNNFWNFFGPEVNFWKWPQNSFLANLQIIWMFGRSKL